MASAVYTRIIYVWGSVPHTHVGYFYGPAPDGYTIVITDISAVCDATLECFLLIGISSTAHTPRTTVPWAINYIWVASATTTNNQAPFLHWSGRLAIPKGWWANIYGQGGRWSGVATGYALKWATDTTTGLLGP